MTEKYFFDTYALFEIINGSKNYEKFKDAVAITTIFNMTELNYGLKKKFENEFADEITDNYKDILIDVELEDIKKAMSLRKNNKDMSAPDCIGYIIAKKLNIKFLTGDEDFRNLDNVEFIKK